MGENGQTDRVSTALSAGCRPCRPNIHVSRGGPPRMFGEKRHAHVSIDGGAFTINGRPTYAGRAHEGHSIEGLLFNARLVHAIFDDENPETVDNWAIPTPASGIQNATFRSFSRRYRSSSTRTITFASAPRATCWRPPRGLLGVSIPARTTTGTAISPVRWNPRRPANALRVSRRCDRPRRLLSE